jgi:hypothetical protein
MRIDGDKNVFGGRRGVVARNARNANYAFNFFFERVPIPSRLSLLRCSAEGTIRPHSAWTSNSGIMKSVYIMTYGQDVDLSSISYEQ